MKEYSADVPLDDVMLRVCFTMTPGHPGCMYLSNGDPGFPPEPNEIEIIDVRYLNDDGKPMELAAVGLADHELEQVETWLAENFEAPGPDPDEMREDQREDERLARLFGDDADDD